jgi:hypothetical protein
MPARAVTALDIAFRRHRQMDAAIFVMIAAKTGMPLDIFPLIAFCRHFQLPSLPFSSQNGKGPSEIFRWAPLPYQFRGIPLPAVFL